MELPLTMINSNKPHYDALEKLLVGNPELEQLEALIANFNIFEAIGVIQQELRHSDFLGFLLDPRQNHGLSDAFVTRFLQRVIQGTPRESLSISPIDLDLWSLDNLIVLRERQNIDLLLLDSSHELAIIIENKIGSKEHSGQLERYYQTVRNQYPGWKILALYLTPDGDLPLDQRYIACSYTVVSEICDEILLSRESTMGGDIQILIKHYQQMLRRHILSDTDISRLCKNIYQKHKRALDLIFEHRPDRQDEIRRFLELLISEKNTLILDHSTKSYVYFLDKVWDFDELRVMEGVTPSHRILLFNFENYTDRLYLRLSIGPGPQELRERLFLVGQQDNVFNVNAAKLGTKYQTIYAKPFITAKADANLDMEELQSRIRKNWETFINQDLAKINDAIEKKTWLTPPTL